MIMHFRGGMTAMPDFVTDTGLVAVCGACGAQATGNPLLGGALGALAGVAIRHGLPVVVRELAAWVRSRAKR